MKFGQVADWRPEAAITMHFEARQLKADLETLRTN